MTDALWQLGGWTMLHFLWLGTAVALVGGTLRFTCRRAAPSVRYAVSLAVLALLAVLPLGIAAIVAKQLNPVTPRYSEGSNEHGRSIIARAQAVVPAKRSGSPRQSTRFSLPHTDDSPSRNDSVNDAKPPRVIDLAFVDPTATDDDATAPRMLVGATNPSPSPSLLGRGDWRRHPRGEPPLALAHRRPAHLCVVGIRTRRFGTTASKQHHAHRRPRGGGERTASPGHADHAARFGRRVRSARPTGAGGHHPPAHPAAGRRPRRLDSPRVGNGAATRTGPRPPLGQPREPRAEQIAKMPNESLRAAIVEHKIRHDSATASLKKYEEELREAKAALAELNLAARETNGEHSKAAANPPAAFPSLEVQKIADRAYKLLGWELEPLTADELAIAKQHGYDGGLRIEGSKHWQPGTVARDMPVYGDLLVGLHTWPVRNLSDLDEILRREDLRELAPLKFYVASRFLDRGNQDAWKANRGNWQLMKGRVEVDRQWLATIERDSRDRQFNAKQKEADQELAQMEAVASELEAVPATKATGVPVVVTMVQPPTHADGKTTAFLRVGMVWNKDRISPQNVERAHMNQLALVKSPDLIALALKLPKAEALKSVRRTDVEAWLINRLKASFPGDGDIMELVLTGEDSSADDDRVLLGAIIEAYINFAAHEAQQSGAPTLAGGEAIPSSSPSLQGRKMDLPAASTLKPADEIKIVAQGVFPEWPLDGVYRIEEAGTVALGLAYGRISVAGQTILEAEKTVKAHLETILTDVEVQLTLHERGANAPETSGDSNAIYLYDGKTFDDWRSLWKNELKTERRIEAIDALAAFARAGYGRDAAEAILDVAAEYDFTTIDQSPEGKLKERVTQVLTLGSASRVPASDWLIVLIERLENDPDKWRPLASMLFFAAAPETVYTSDMPTRKLLLQLASEPKYGLNAHALTALHFRNPEGSGDPEVTPLIKAALKGEDVASALAVLKSLWFGDLDAWPEQFDLLFHMDAATRRTARTILKGTATRSRQAVADRLVAVLEDPKRAEDHADAIRALGVLLQTNNFGGTGRETWPDEDAHKRISERLNQITREGPPELFVPALVALGVISVDAVDQLLTGIQASEPEEHKERVKQARDKIDAEVEQLVDPPNPGSFGGGADMGGGGGFF